MSGSKGKRKGKGHARQKDRSAELTGSFPQNAVATPHPPDEWSVEDDAIDEMLRDAGELLADGDGEGGESDHALRDAVQVLEAASNRLSIFLPFSSPFPPPKNSDAVALLVVLCTFSQTQNGMFLCRFCGCPLTSAPLTLFP
jgi:hypothetical protein